MNLIKVERIVFYILLNGFSLLLKPFFRRFKIFDFAVLVYPGTKKDITAYFPGFFKKIFPTISMMGFIKNHKNKKYGIILATKYYIEEIKQKKKEVLWEVERFASLIGVKK